MNSNLLPNQFLMSSHSRSKLLTLQSLNHHLFRSIRTIYCSSNRNHNLNPGTHLNHLHSHHHRIAAVKQIVRSTQLRSALQIIKATFSYLNNKYLTLQQVLIEAIINNSSRSNNHIKFFRKARRAHLAQQLRNHNQCTNQQKILKSFHLAPRRIALISITLSARVDLVKYGKSSTGRHASCLL